MMKILTKQINGNFESLGLNHAANFDNLIKNFPVKFAGDLIFRMQRIGQYQLLRKLITTQIHFAARCESTQYQNCLETLNNSVLHNLNEIKENAVFAMNGPMDF